MGSPGASCRPEPLELEVAVRAWTRADYLRHIPRRDRSEYQDLGPSGWSLTIDVETTVAVGQRLRVGGYQIRRKDDVVESGLFYDVSVLTEDEMVVLSSFAAANGLRILTVRKFVADIFFRVVCDRRGLLVGANLPFDLSRLAIDHGPAKRSRAMRGGFSLVLTRDPRRPHIQLKRVGARATLIRLTIPARRSAEQRNREQGGNMASHRGYFIDVLGLGAALLGNAYSLAGLTAVLNTQTRKAASDSHGTELTTAYLGYLVGDLEATWECYLILRERYQALNLTETPLHAIYSEASIGKGFFRQLGLKPWQECQPAVPDWLIATILEAYYGARCASTIRRLPVAGLYCDFLAQYPSVFVLLRLWPFLIARGISWQDDDPTEVQALLERVTADDLLGPELWRGLHALCLVEPDGDRLPTRARYNGRTYNVAVADRTDRLRQWYTLADCIASKLETGKPPRIVRLLRFAPLGPQRGLRTITLPGRLEVDPYKDDLIKTLVEQRARVKRERDKAKADGDLELERRLDAEQLGMKAASNASSYGTPIEINITEHKRPISITVHRPDGSSYHTRSHRIEEPGTWFHPLVGSFVASGGRLMLAAAIALFREAGAAHSCADTDALFVAATRTGEGNDGVPTLRWRDALSIVQRFSPLNRYDPEVIPGSLLELEPENRDPETGDLRELLCVSLASKRYSLWTNGPNGRPQIVGRSGKRRRSEHGLGHLVPPRNLDPEAFYDQWWEHLLCLELGIDDPQPEWFDDIAAGRLTITSLRTEQAFRAFNESLPYEDRVRPWNFCTIVHVSRVHRAITGIRCLVASYERDTGKLADLDWNSRNDPHQRTYAISADGSLEITEGLIRVQTYRDYFEEYRRHPEAKALAPDGKRCHPWTRGLLRPPRVRATRLARVGKEANPLTDTLDLVLDQDDRVVEYRELRCQECGKALRGRQQLWCGEVCRKRAARRS
jgi:hypothetical protein